jgi:peptidyl-prolyl cis-trans isomerase C
MLNKSKLLLGATCAVFALSACNKSADNASASSKASASADANAVAATVNGKAISQKQLDVIVQGQAAQGMPDTPEMRKMIVEQLSLQMLAAGEAEKKGLDKTADVKQKLEMTKLGVLAESYVEDYFKNTQVTDAQLAEEYKKFTEKTAGKQYMARHILVEKEEQAKAIIAKLKTNVKEFSALAKAQSKDQGSAIKGGDLGWFDAKTMVPEFSQAVAALEKGKFTETPVKTQFGFHVMILDDTRDNPVPPLDQVKERLKQQFLQTNLRKNLDDLKAKAKIEYKGALAAVASAAAATPAAASAHDDNHKH